MIHSCLTKVQKQDGTCVSVRRLDRCTRTCFPRFYQCTRTCFPRFYHCTTKVLISCTCMYVRRLDRCTRNFALFLPLHTKVLLLLVLLCLSADWAVHSYSLIHLILLSIYFWPPFFAVDWLACLLGVLLFRCLFPMVCWDLFFCCFGLDRFLLAASSPSPVHPLDWSFGAWSASTSGVRPPEDGKMTSSVDFC